MKLTLALVSTFVCVFSVPSFAARRDCAGAILSEEKFAFREINRPADAVLGAFYLQAFNLERQSTKGIGEKRHRSFGLIFTPPGASQPVEAAGSTMSREDSRGVRVKFAPEMLQKPAFREALETLIDETSSAHQLWPYIAPALDAVRTRI